MGCCKVRPVYDFFYENCVPGKFYTFVNCVPGLYHIILYNLQVTSEYYKNIVVCSTYTIQNFEVANRVLSCTLKILECYNLKISENY